MGRASQPAQRESSGPFATDQIGEWSELNYIYAFNRPTLTLSRKSKNKQTNKTPKTPNKPGDTYHSLLSKIGVSGRDKFIGKTLRVASINKSGFSFQAVFEALSDLK